MEVYSNNQYIKAQKYIFRKTLLTFQPVWWNKKKIHFHNTQPAFTITKLTIETLKIGVKYVQS